MSLPVAHARPRWPHLERLIALLLLALASGAPTAARAARAEIDVLREASGVASAIMSPFCPGRTLSACPSPRAAEWRAEIRTWVAEGVPREQILQRLQARVPEINLTSDRNALYGWIAPALALLAFSALTVGVGRRLLRGRRGRPAGPQRPLEAPASSGDDPALAAYSELLDAELRRE